MRFFVIKQDTSLKTLASQLVREGTAEAAAVDRLQKLNPHVDLERIGRNTVLLLPDAPGYKAEGDKVGDDGFGLFAKEVASALRDGTKRAKDALAQAEAVEKDVGKLFKSAAVRKLADDDSELNTRLELAGTRTSSVAKESRTIAPQLDALQQGAAEELKKLRALLG